MNKKAILVFGVGELQKSLIQRAHKKNLFVVGIDPCENAFCKEEVDAFEVVGGQDFEGTLTVAKKYSISAIVTVATDKPLVMMARIAKELHLPFYSLETAENSTDKFKMKEKFLEYNIPCAKGMLIRSTSEVSDYTYPLIVKPRDNSGSRGVKLCRNKDELQCCLDEAFQYSHKDSVLVEEYIEGPEYSIESLHYNGKSEVIQFTEKRTTEFPYNVELGHKQPANLSIEQKARIKEIINLIAKALKFENCPSHTELKINERGIFVIETSPRLGGDYITSTLVPLSTGINMEDQLINLALGEKIDIHSGYKEQSSGVCFFSLPEGTIESIDKKIENVNQWNGIVDFSFKLNAGDSINKITSSLNRYGSFIVHADNRKQIDTLIEQYESKITSFISMK